MSNKPKAFPSTENGRIFDPGMDLRDWFAGQALASLNEPDFDSWHDMSEAAYKIADAMMQRR
jgi:hypothetical protein